ncbi:MAG TPA: RidA family protein [Actinophytocola sp.]|uniref:RidA family protein n=1 Tax=Actinophytocola sp. TaxID=1872138 RepID=UPI002DDCB6D6|nr:RidA family protein [Actinophytocola sp.]HEV2780429.1 RidA family protein [Actinophytocola sp.]
MDGAMIPHEIIPVPELMEPVGFAHAIVTAPGRTVHLAGQTAHGDDGEIQGSSIVEQFDAAAWNVVTALRAAGASPYHVASMTIYVTDIAEYRACRRELVPVWRKHFGRYYPAAALIGVSELVDPAAKVELVCTAVIPA